MTRNQTTIKKPVRVCQNLGFSAAFIITAFSQAVAGTSSIPYSHGDPTNYEQYQLELINAARANPSAEAARLSIDLNQGLTEGRISTDAKQPLAFHPLLLHTARGHSDWMLNTNTFSHTGSSGSTPTERAAGNGYDFGVAENIAYYSTSGILDEARITLVTYNDLFKSKHHRPNLMDPSYSVVGLGLREGNFNDLNALMVTQNFSSGGDSLDSGPFLVGVVYDDKNDNGVYDPDEGLEGVRVEPNYGDYHAITTASGGYAVPLPPNEILTEDVPIDLVVDESNEESIRLFEKSYREEKIKNAEQINVQVTFTVGNLKQIIRNEVIMRKPTRIKYKLTGTNDRFWENTMVSSLNVKQDLKLKSPKIKTQTHMTWVKNGHSTDLEVTAIGTEPLLYQWYQGNVGDTSKPVGTNSATLTTSSLTQATSYWVRITNLAGSADSSAVKVVVAGSEQTLYSHGDPTNFEQYQLELVNAARANPLAEATRLVEAVRANPKATKEDRLILIDTKGNIDLNQGLEAGEHISSEFKQPLAFHPLLLKTARGHSDWMLSTDTFSHTGLSGSTPTTPTKRAEINGYAYSVAENIAYLSTSGILNSKTYSLGTHENLFKSHSHRPNLLNPRFTVVGLGLEEGKFYDAKEKKRLNTLMVTQNFSSGGDSIDSGPFLVGVVYDDKNDNGVYDPGEGVEGVRVEPSYGGYHAITSASGGYAVPLPPKTTILEDELLDFDVNASNEQLVRSYDISYREKKISNADSMDVQVAFTKHGVNQTIENEVTLLEPARISYKFIGTDNGTFEDTMVSSMNVKQDLKLKSPYITNQVNLTWVISGNSTNLQVSATGTELSYQWYQGAKGDTSTPVGTNSSSLTTPPLSQTTNYWVRIANLAGTVDSSVITVAVLDLPSNSLNVGNQVTSNFAALIASGRTLKVVGKLPTGLKFNANTGALSGIITKAGTYSASIQVLSGKTLLTTIPLNFQVAAFPSTLAGAYEAIVRDAQGTPKGAFSLIIGTNAWSAILRESGQSSLSAKGSFILDTGNPTATLSITFKGKAPMNLKLDGNSPIINASMSDLVLEGFKLASTAENPTSPQAVAMVLDSGEADGVSLPAGFGWASGSISKLGKGSLVGMLADGTKLTAPISLSTTGQAVLWVQPYKNRSSYLAGVISVDGIGQPSNTDLAIAESCIWVLNPGEKGNPYGFSDGLDIDVRFGKIQQPTASSSLSVDLLGTPKNSSGNDLDWPSLFTVDAKYNLIATGSSIAWKGKINTKNGSFSGTYTIPKGTTPEVIGTTASASGVFLQDAVSGQSIGYGLIKVPVAPTGTFRTAGIFIKSP